MYNMSMILVISSPNVYAAKRLKDEAQKRSTDLEILSAADLVDKNFNIDINRYDVLYVRDPYNNSRADFLPQIIELAKKFRSAGKKDMDAVIAEGELGEGKGIDYDRLRQASITIPQTQPWSVQSKILNLQSKIITKWIYGFKGQSTFLIQKQSDLDKIPSYIPKSELLQQEFIDADFEYKVITVGYKSLPVILRFAVNKKTHRPDFEKYDVIPSSENLELAKLAEKSSALLKRELAKVDILEKNGKFYVLEVNRFPGLSSFEELTKYNVGEDFISYLSQG